MNGGTCKRKNIKQTVINYCHCEQGFKGSTCRRFKINKNSKLVDIDDLFKKIYKKYNLNIIT